MYACDETKNLITISHSGNPLDGSDTARKVQDFYTFHFKWASECRQHWRKLNTTKQTINGTLLPVKLKQISGVQWKFSSATSLLAALLPTT